MLALLLIFLFIPGLLVSISLLFLLLYIALYRAPSTTNRSSLGRSAAVVVLGDVGRSPRMCYHVESLADQGWKVSVVGYGGSKLPSAIQRSSVKFLRLSEVPPWIARLPRAAFVAVAPFKLMWQSAGLFWKVTMTVQPPPEVLFVQTPPALPTLFVIRICSLLLGCRVIIDWHNLAYTILALRLGNSSAPVRLARWLEKVSGRHAFAHLFVTHAMQIHLQSEWGLQGQMAVLHDRPPKHFRKVGPDTAHALWRGLSPRLQPSLEDFWPPGNPADESLLTPFTTVDPVSRSAAWRVDRPAIAVSSTSWTADEDFGLLLRAARQYEKRAQELNNPAPTGRNSPSNAYNERHHKRSSTGFSSGSRDASGLLDSPRTSTDLLISPTKRSSRNLASPEAARSSPSIPEDPSIPSSSNASSSSHRTHHRSRRPSNASQRSMSLLPNLPANKLPKLLIVVTGKGELRAQYEREIAKLEKEEKWAYVRIRTGWLENWEYPLLLGSADVGVSLHTSSSGLDLPMKVVDMLGCQLPVLALDFACLDELVQNGRNGLTFSDEWQLCDGIESLLGDFPGDETGSTWLARLGGLKQPFTKPPAEKSLGEDLSSPDEPFVRSPSLESLGFSNGERGPKIDRVSLDFSKGGLPTTNSFGSLNSPVRPALSPLLGPGSPFWAASTDANAESPSRPLTPTPSFTMLASPVLGPGFEFQATPPKQGSRTPEKREAKTDNKDLTTWAGNWKAVVRPLLRLADEEDAEEEGCLISDDGEDEDEDDADQIDKDEVATLLGPKHLRFENDRMASHLACSPSSRADLYESSVRSGLSPSSSLLASIYNRGSIANAKSPLRSPVVRRAKAKHPRVRGGSVHDLLWGEDFAPLSPNGTRPGRSRAAGAEASVSGSVASTPSRPGLAHVIAINGGSAGQEEEEEEEEPNLTLFGMISPSASYTPHSRRQASRRSGLSRSTSLKEGRSPRLMAASQPNTPSRTKSAKGSVVGALSSLSPFRRTPSDVSQRTILQRRNSEEGDAGAGITEPNDSPSLDRKGKATQTTTTKTTSSSSTPASGPNQAQVHRRRTTRLTTADLDVDLDVDANDDHDVDEVDSRTLSNKNPVRPSPLRGGSPASTIRPSASQSDVFGPSAATLGREMPRRSASGSTTVPSSSSRASAGTGAGAGAGAGAGTAAAATATAAEVPHIRVSGADS